MTTSWLSRILELSPTAAAATGTKFYGDLPTTDFTIACSGREFPVHRVILCKQSRFFKACCTRPFLEATHQRVELCEDVLAAVKAMIEFFYHGIYCHTFTPSRNSRCEGIDLSTLSHLHAHVYAIAEKYDLPELKHHAFVNFKMSLDFRTREQMEGLVRTVYRHIELPESDDRLQITLLVSWTWTGGGCAHWSRNHVKAFLRDEPEFAEDVDMEDY